MKYKLSKTRNFIEFKNGKSIKPSVAGIYPVYGANGIIGMANEWQEQNSVIIGRVGAYCGTVQFCKGQYWASDNTIVAWPKGNDTNVCFLYYLLKYANLNQWAGGAAQPLLTQTVIREIELPYPDIIYQQKIAAVLSAYDDLIENNTRRIQILEEVAQMIYNEWFVKFRFPGYEKVRFVDSELGKIPEGWSVEKLDKYVDFEKGIEPGSSNYEQESNEENLPFLRVGDLNNRSAEIFINWSLAKNKIVKEDDIVISMDGTPGIVKMGLFGCYSTGIRKLIIKTNVIKKSFLYFLMLSERIQNIIKAHSKGTTILHASESIRNMNFILPDNNLMDLYDNLVSPMVKETLLLNKKNKILRQTRDLLLPKLISGELDVSDMDIKIKEKDLEQGK